MEAKTYKIIDGPSVFDLAIALFHGAPSHSVSFTVKSGATVGSISCQIFVAKKAIKGDIKPVEWLLEGDTWASETQSYSASYSTQTRKGFIKIHKRKR